MNNNYMKNNDIDFNTSALAGDVFFYKLKARNFIQINK